MVNYKNGKIYKMVNDELGLTYYGSTCGELRSRLCAHKTQAKTRNITSKLLFDQGVCKIFLVEEYPTENKMLLLQRERFYIENNECVNKFLPGRTQKEWYVDNKKQRQAYLLKNSDKIKERMKEYRNNNRDKMQQYRVKHSDEIKEQKKEWYVDNRDERLEKMKQYQVKNTDKIKARKDLYYQKNKEKIKADNKAYRAKKKLEKSLEPN
jgi:hypothetical protein